MFLPRDSGFYEIHPGSELCGIRRSYGVGERVVIAAHGANLINLFWVSNHTQQLVEVMPPGFYSNMFRLEFNMLRAVAIAPSELQYTELVMDEDDGELQWRMHQVSEGQPNYELARCRELHARAIGLSPTTVPPDDSPRPNPDLGIVIRTQAQAHPIYQKQCVSVWIRPTAGVKSGMFSTLRSHQNRHGLRPTRAPSTSLPVKCKRRCAVRVETMARSDSL